MPGLQSLGLRALRQVPSSLAGQYLCELVKNAAGDISALATQLQQHNGKLAGFAAAGGACFGIADVLMQVSLTCMTRFCVVKQKDCAGLARGCKACSNPQQRLGAAISARHCMMSLPLAFTYRQDRPDLRLCNHLFISRGHHYIPIIIVAFIGGA